MTYKAKVYQYPDDTTGWVLAVGRHNNLFINDPDTEVIVDVNPGERPISGKPLRKQRVNVGVFADATSADLSAMKIWLSTKFQSGPG